jgi:hypothetical protein
VCSARYAYDTLNRFTTTDVSVGADIASTDDNLGRLLTASDGSQTLTTVYDALVRLRSCGQARHIVERIDDHDIRL